MKKLLLVATLMLAGLASQAQNYLGGSVGFMRDLSSHESNFTLAPEFGYTYSEHWGVGITLNYLYKNYSGSISNSFAFSPYARWTFAKVADEKLHFFLDGGFLFGFTKSTGVNTGIFYNIGLKPGISYSFNEHWCILTHLGFVGYEGSDRIAESLGYHRKFGLDFSSMNVNLGVYYTF